MALANWTVEALKFQEAKLVSRLAAAKAAIPVAEAAFAAVYPTEPAWATQPIETHTAMEVARQQPKHIRRLLSAVRRELARR
jgi:hypothetical protein